VHRGFFVYSGNVAMNNLAIQNAQTLGGGGGLGAGGAMFVASDGNVTLSNVQLTNNTASGGIGGNYLAAAPGPGPCCSGTKLRRKCKGLWEDHSPR
jgi:hypothetical protein